MTAAADNDNAPRADHDDVSVMCVRVHVHVSAVGDPVGIRVHAARAVRATVAVVRDDVDPVGVAVGVLVYVVARWWAWHAAVAASAVAAAVAHVWALPRAMLSLVYLCCSSVAVSVVVVVVLLWLQL